MLLCHTRTCNQNIIHVSNSTGYTPSTIRICSIVWIKPYMNLELDTALGSVRTISNFFAFLHFLTPKLGVWKCIYAFAECMCIVAASAFLAKILASLSWPGIFLKKSSHPPSALAEKSFAHLHVVSFPQRSSYWPDFETHYCPFQLSLVSLH